MSAAKIQPELPRIALRSGGLVRRAWRWILRRPDSSLVLLNIRDAARTLHRCTNWQTWADPGEEDHGHNPARRRCVDCGKIQHAFYHRFGNTRIAWSDAPNDRNEPRRT